MYGGIGFAGVNGLASSPFNTDWNNVQPRIGAAFQLTPKTVLRGGWGISYLTNVSTGASYRLQPEHALRRHQRCAGARSASVVSNPFPSGISSPRASRSAWRPCSARARPSRMRSGTLGYVHSFSFGIQRLLPWQISLDVSYVGSRTIGSRPPGLQRTARRTELALGDPHQGRQSELPHGGRCRIRLPDLLPGSVVNGATITAPAVAAPFREFTSFNRQDSQRGKVWYNSLQVAFNKRYRTA